MKNKLLACATAMGILLSAMPVGGITAYAEDTEALPGWIPTSLEETVDFCNQYGATHIEDGVICVVFEESLNDIYSYEAVSTDDSCKLSREVYENNNTYSKYEVIAYRPKTAGEFNVELNRTQNDNVRKDSSYTFLADDSGNITETDIYGIIPDCITEYNDFKAKYGETSIQENYIVYCGDINYSCGHSLIMEQNGTAEIKQTAISGCSERSLEMPAAGNTSYNIYVYQAVSDGTVDVSWKVGQEWNLENSLVSNIENKYEIKDNVITDITSAEEEQEWEIIGNSVYFTDLFIIGYAPEQLFDIDYTAEFNEIGCKTVITPKTDGKYYAITTDHKKEKRSLEDGSHMHYIYNVLTNYTITVKDGIPSVKKEGECSCHSESEIQKYLNGSACNTPCDEEKCRGHLWSEELSTMKNPVLSYFNGTIGSQNDKFFITIIDQNIASSALVINHIVEEAVTADGSQLNVNTIESSSSINADFTLATPDWFPNAVISARWTLFEDPIEDGTALFTVNDGDSTTCYAIDIIDENIIPSTLRVVDTSIRGDLNGDGELTIADVVVLQDWLINSYDKELINWKAADLCEDDVLDVYDLCMMKQELLKL